MSNPKEKNQNHYQKIKDHNQIVRILQLVDCDTVEEYLQTLNGGKIATGRKFPLEMLMSSIAQKREKQIITGGLSENPETYEDIYQFLYKGDCNLEPTSTSNLHTNNLAIIVPGDVKETYRDDPRMLNTLATLTATVIDVNRRAKVRNAKLQKQNAIIKTATKVTLVALGVAAAIHFAPKAYSFIQEQQQQQRQEFYQDLREYSQPTRDELREERIRSEQDPELMRFLEEIRQQNEESRKQL